MERNKVIVRPKLRRDVYPAEATMKSRLLAEFVGGGLFRVMANLAEGSQGDVELKFRFDNYTTHNLLQLDEQKIFLVDDKGFTFTFMQQAESCASA